MNPVGLWPKLLQESCLGAGDQNGLTHLELLKACLCVINVYSATYDWRFRPTSAVGANRTHDHHPYDAGWPYVYISLYMRNIQYTCGDNPFCVGDVRTYGLPLPVMSG